MATRRSVLRRLGLMATTVSLTATAGCLDAGVVRTKAGGGFGGTIDLESPDAEAFVLPDEFTTYANRSRDRYGELAVPWTEPTSLPGEFVGAYTRREDVVPNQRFAVQDAVVIVHRLDDVRYRLRLWSAGRLLGKTYEIDPWGYYRERMAFTWLEHDVTAARDDQLSTTHSLTTDGGRVSIANGDVTVPDGSYEMGLADARYRSRWDGFHPGDVALIGACEVSFTDGDERRLDWTLSNGIGVRTPF